MTQPAPHAAGQAHPAPDDEVPADEQETVRLSRPDPDATRPMSLADLLDTD